MSDSRAARRRSSASRKTGSALFRGRRLDRLPRLVGRARAIEIVLGADNFDADTAESTAGSTAPSLTLSSTPSLANFVQAHALVRRSSPGHQQGISTRQATGQKSASGDGGHVLGDSPLARRGAERYEGARTRPRRGRDCTSWTSAAPWQNCRNRDASLGKAGQDERHHTRAAVIAHARRASSASTLEEREAAAPGPDEVVVQVEATPINPADLGELLGPVDLSTL